MDKKPLTKEEFRLKMMERIQEEAQRTGKPEYQVVKEMNERLREKLVKKIDETNPSESQ